MGRCRVHVGIVVSLVAISVGGLCVVPPAGAVAPYAGGLYKFLKNVANAQYRNDNEVHHLLSAKALKDAGLGDSANCGPSITMDTLDHQETASWGKSALAVAYRAQQTALIEAGNSDAALQMDIDNIRSLFGSKYDVAIQQALDAWAAIKDSFANLDQFCNPKPPGSPPLPPFPQPSGVPSAELPVIDPSDGGTAPVDAYAVLADVSESDNTDWGSSAGAVITT